VKQSEQKMEKPPRGGFFVRLPVGILHQQVVNDTRVGPPPLSASSPGQGLVTFGVCALDGKI